MSEFRAVGCVTDNLKPTPFHIHSTSGCRILRVPGPDCDSVRRSISSVSLLLSGCCRLSDSILEIPLVDYRVDGLVKVESSASQLSDVIRVLGVDVVSFVLQLVFYLECG